ncbi:hypothetical protein [Citrobacter sp. R56]|nr:hypothetical protein [Citrobacter sp. R56]
MKISLNANAGSISVLGAQYGNSRRRWWGGGELAELIDTVNTND